MMCVRAVHGPIQNGLIVLIHSGVVSAETHPHTLERGIESGLGECIPDALENVDPLRIVLGEGKLIRYLEVQLRCAAIASGPINDQIVERIAERGALALHTRGEFAGQSTYGRLAKDSSKARRRYSRFQMRTAAACCVGTGHSS
jgi:hypothetical protein